MALFTITALLAISSTCGINLRKPSKFVDLYMKEEAEVAGDIENIGCSGTYLQTYDKSFQALAQKEEACQQPRWKENPQDLVKDLAGWKDVHLLETVPTAEEAARWKKKVIVVNEGEWRMNSGATHFYNIASQEIPHLASFVLDPLQAAGRIGSTEIILAKERPTTKCTAGFAKLNVTKMKVTYSQLMKECKSGIEILPSIFPDVQLSFKDGVPFCEKPGSCHVPEVSGSFIEDTTVLVIRMARPIGWQWPHDRSPFCDQQKAKSARAWVHKSTKKPQGAPDQITLIMRAPDVHSNSEKYHYERPFSGLISNWKDIEEAITPWAKAKGLSVRKVVLEELPFPEQIEIIRKTKILVGHEGAGLANMIYFEDPKKSGVVEIQDGEEFMKYGEFPTIARNLGVPLAFHTYHCGGQGTDVNPAKLIDAMGKLLKEL